MFRCLPDDIRDDIAIGGLRNSHVTAIAPADTISLRDYSLRRWRADHPDGPLPTYFVSACQLAPKEHLAMQAALQPFVDNAISKTINVPKDYELKEFQSLYDEAYRLELKGCTTFRPNTKSGAMLQVRDASSG